MSRLFTVFAVLAIGLSLTSTAEAGYGLFGHRQRVVVRQQVVVQKVFATPVVQAAVVQQIVAQPVVQQVYAQPIVTQAVIGSSCYGQAQLVAPIVGGRGSACFFGR